jgi:hypothetical protein
MAEYRLIQTRIWVDAWFLELSLEGKLLFVYLFTNQRASVCGLYELPMRVMAFDTGMDLNSIKKYLDIFSKTDKAYYDFTTSVIWVVNMPKYQGTTSPKLLPRIMADVKAVPGCELKTKFLQKYPIYTVSIPYGYSSDTTIKESESESESESVSESVKEGGPGGEKNSPAALEFMAHFRSFNGKNERQRWEILVELIGLSRAKEIATWAERKEIHLVNRGGLLDSLETAAKKWIKKSGDLKDENVGEHNKRVVKELVYGNK